MKIRSGFVSNSSSSSFIVGIAKILDREKFDAWAKSVNARDLEVLKVKDLSHWNKNDKIAYNESFRGDRCSILLEDLDLEDEVVLLDFMGGSDADFTIYDEDGDFSDYDYDIDFSHFDKAEQDLYDGFSKSNGLAMVQKGYGAGRNG